MDPDRFVIGLLIKHSRKTDQALVANPSRVKAKATHSVMFIDQLRDRIYLATSKRQASKDQHLGRDLFGKFCWSVDVWENLIVSNECLIDLMVLPQHALEHTAKIGRFLSGIEEARRQFLNDWLSEARSDQPIKVDTYKLYKGVDALFPGYHVGFRLGNSKKQSKLFRVWWLLTFLVESNIEVRQQLKQYFDILGWF
jgi:hypothetical protein